MKRYGFKPSDTPPVDPEPPQPYTNPKTGEVLQVPAGIDPGFAYNPGRAALTAHAARIVATKWVDAPPRITAADQAARGATLGVEELKTLPDVLGDPDVTLFDNSDPALLYVFSPADGVNLGKVVVRIDFFDRVKREKIVTNAVRSGGRIDRGDLKEKLRDGTPRYVKIWKPS